MTILGKPEFNIFRRNRHRFFSFSPSRYNKQQQNREKKEKTLREMTRGFYFYKQLPDRTGDCLLNPCFAPCGSMAVLVNFIPLVNIWQDFDTFNALASCNTRMGDCDPFTFPSATWT
mmetsp:Transcript_62246/g.71366  ORF Transcript_62246/g.71366 Transcript_62246/m.71366 type:complete len:117 (-) Transcript_62246:1482-1832(-)